MNLADVIIERGPYENGQLIPEPLRYPTSDGMNELREELISGRRPAVEGYQAAIETLRDVARRTGSPAARWAADYLEADPDRRGPIRPQEDV